MEIAQHSLPTPNARDGGGGGAQHPDHRKKGNHQVCLTDAATVMGENSEAPTSMFGRYTDAVRRWEDTINRPAPSPTELNTKNKPRLAAPLCRVDDGATCRVGNQRGDRPDPNTAVASYRQRCRAAAGSNCACIPT